MKSRWQVSRWQKVKAFCWQEWYVRPVQVIGAGLLIPAFVLAVVAARMSSIGMAYGSWAILALVGGLDLYILHLAKELDLEPVTITRWIRNLMPKHVDNMVMIGFIVLLWWLAGPLYSLFYMHGFLNDHFNEDRKKGE